MKEIVDQKTLYLIRTLSRTNRKDYENYVINAIWQKLNNNDIEVVSQQYVRNVAKKTGRSHYFIDLYFPALNIGIECDEAFHKKESNSDKEREATIFDVIFEVNVDNDFRCIHIDTTLSFEALQDRLKNAVIEIQQKISEINPPKWTIQRAEEYYRDKSEISIHDKKGFKSISSACNILFKAGRSETSGGASRSYFSLPTFKGTCIEDYKMWFPKLAIPIKNEDGSITLTAATKYGWNNQLIDDGRTIIERNEKDSKLSKSDGKNRIVFVKYKDPLGNNEYKFAGIFEFNRATDEATYFRRIKEEISLIKP